MYKNNKKQLKFEDFYLPFGGELRRDNRWVKLAKLIPWHEFETLYAHTLTGTGMGALAMSVRMAPGSLIIKERLCASDKETVQQIRENPYLLYFLRFEEYKKETPSHPTMFVLFRKRLGKEVLTNINEVITSRAIKGSSPKEKNYAGKNDYDPDPPTDPGENKDKLIMNASFAPADINFPIELKVLNDVRGKSEEIIDTLHEPLVGNQKKPRTYREKTRKQFLGTTKKKKLPK